MPTADGVHAQLARPHSFFRSRGWCPRRERWTTKERHPPPVLLRPPGHDLFLAPSFIFWSPAISLRAIRCCSRYFTMSSLSDKQSNPSVDTVSSLRRFRCDFGLPPLDCDPRPESTAARLPRDSRVLVAGAPSTGRPSPYGRSRVALPAGRFSRLVCAESTVAREPAQHSASGAACVAHSRKDRQVAPAVLLDMAQCGFQPP